MNRILVPLDGSALSEGILPVAVELAREQEAELVLLQVVATESSGSVGVRAREQAESYLGRVTRDLASRGTARVRSGIWYGEPDQAIVNAASHERVDLVAMSTHGRGGLSRLRFGSVAASVVRKTATPVLLVRGEASWGSGGMGRILVPLDGSELSEGVLPAVTQLAGPFDFAVDLLHAVERVTSASVGHAAGLAEERDRLVEAEEYLGKTTVALEARGLRVRCLVRFGPAAEVIPRVAAEAVSGLIAMSTHGRTGLDRLLLGSVAERVLRSVSIPVLLWRVPAGRSAGGRGGS